MPFDLNADGEALSTEPQLSLLATDAKNARDIAAAIRTMVLFCSAADLEHVVADW